jgi:ATP/maltotriose-dependent transcriptional regulator MalT
MRIEPPDKMVSSAREAFRRHDWPGAYGAYQDARAAGALLPEDLAALADAAWWIGHVGEAMEVYEEAWRIYRETGQSRAAAMIALTIGYTRAMRGEMAIASGWIARSARLLRDEPDCAERGFLVYIEIEEAMSRGDVDAALGDARAIQEMGARFGDPNLAALGMLAEGVGMMRQGATGRGLALLDEAMLAAVSDDLDPAWAGHIYCNVIAACEETGDLRRAAEWTDATMRWCESLTASGPFLGICRVHRARIHQLQGRWDQSEREARNVYTGDPWFDVATLGEAHYQVGEVLRLRGDYDGALDAYRRAHELGREPQPGLALVHAAQGEVPLATVALQAALAATPAPLRRVRLLAAQADVALTAGETSTAMKASAELDEITRAHIGPGLVAIGHQVRGMALLAQGELAEALTALQAAREIWQSLSAPYDVAKTRMLIAAVRDALGDAAGAAHDRETALASFERLGALPDARAARAGPRSDRAPGGLSEREVEVLRLVAAGMTNRQIGEALFISPKTVGRHLESIYAKLSVPSRAAASAWAMSHNLLPPPDG